MLCMRAQSCPAPCNPMDCSPRGFSVRGIFRQEYWSELPFPTPGDLPNPGMEPMSPASAGRFFTAKSPGNTGISIYAQTGVTPSRNIRKIRIWNSKRKGNKLAKN